MLEFLSSYRHAPDLVAKLRSVLGQPSRTKGPEEHARTVLSLLREEAAHCSHVCTVIAVSARLCTTLYDQLGRDAARRCLKRLSEEPGLPPGARLVLESYLDIDAIQIPTKVVTVISIYGGQIACLPPTAHARGEDAIREKIRQFRDLYGINSSITWELIFVDDGDDRHPGNPCTWERTSSVIARCLGDEFHSADEAGRYTVLEMSDEIRRRLNSVQGAAIVYGMHEALRRGAHIVAYTNIDLDTHVSLQGKLVGALRHDGVAVAVGSNRIQGSSLHAPAIYRHYSAVLNQFVRALLPVGDIADTHNAFKAFDAVHLRKLLPMTADGAFDLDMDYFFSFPDVLLARATLHGLCVREIPVAMHRAAPLQAGLSIRYGARYFYSVWQQRKYLRKWLSGGGSCLRQLPVECLRNDDAIMVISPRVAVHPSPVDSSANGDQEGERTGQSLLKFLCNANGAAPSLDLVTAARKQLAMALRQADSRAIAEDLRRHIDRFPAGSVLRPLIESFLWVLSNTRTFSVSTVVAVCRAEDAIRPEYLSERITQLADLYEVASRIRWRLIVVVEERDGFPDVVWEDRAQRLHRDLLADGRLRFVRIPRSRLAKGTPWFKGGSILIGMSEAIRGSDYVFFADAKPAIDLAQQGVLLRAMTASDGRVAIGSRYTAGAFSIRSRTRRLASRVYHRLVAMILPHLADVADTQCGFKCFSATGLASLNTGPGVGIFDERFDRSLSFDTELLSRSVLAGNRIVELPITSIWKSSEQLRLREALRMTVGLIGQRSRLPTHVRLTSGSTHDVYGLPDGNTVIKCARNNGGGSGMRELSAAKTKLIQASAAWLVQQDWAVALAGFIRTRSRSRAGLSALVGNPEYRHVADIATLKAACSRLSTATVAAFEVREDAWFVLVERGIRRVRQTTLLEQQRMAGSLENMLRELALDGDFTEAQRLIGVTFRLQEDLWRHGYFSADVNVLNDTMVDSAGQARLVDVGALTSDLSRASSLVAGMRDSIEHRFSVACIRQYSKKLAWYYDSCFDATFSLGNLYFHWCRVDGPLARLETSVAKGIARERS